MNKLDRFAGAFNGIRPWSGEVPLGYLVDFLGTLTDANFRVMFGVDPSKVGGGNIQTRLPTIEDGEGWFEIVNWVEAAREARDRYVMVTLGACYGGQAVGSYRALQYLNPMPCKLVAIEPEPDNYNWTRKHMRDNAIDPDDQWIIKAAISDKNDPVLFPVGSPGTGAQNCIATNHPASRKYYAEQIISAGTANKTLRSIMLTNSTGITKNLVPGEDFPAEIKMVSAVTLRDVLSPFDLGDYVESDIQQSEILVFPPFMDLLKRKVRRIHIGTHGTDVHNSLFQLFKDDGWEIIFNFAPNAKYQSELGAFEVNDGVLTVRNPGL